MVFIVDPQARIPTVTIEPRTPNLGTTVGHETQLQSRKRGKRHDPVWKQEKEHQRQLRKQLQAMGVDARELSF